jgi:hypothetical protein
MYNVYFCKNLNFKLKAYLVIIFIFLTLSGKYSKGFSQYEQLLRHFRSKQLFNVSPSVQSY